MGVESRRPSGRAEGGAVHGAAGVAGGGPDGKPARDGARIEASRRIRAERRHTSPAVRPGRGGPMASTARVATRCQRSLEARTGSGDAEPFDHHHRPPQRGHGHDAGWRSSRAAGTGGGWRTSARRQRGSAGARRRCARNPKKRIRTKPCGKTCSRNRRRNSSALTVIVGAGSRAGSPSSERSRGRR